MTLRPSNLFVAVVLAAGLSVASCDSSDTKNTGASGVDTGGGSVGGSDVGGFQLTSISVPHLQIWKINRAITFVFSAPVNFNSVNLNTISIRDVNGLPANGVFSQDATEPRIIVFQPTCPVKADFSDAGFLPGGKRYKIQVLGTGSGTGITVTSADGRPLDAPQEREFFTPSSLELSTLFEDSVPGAPLPVIRTEGSANQDATFVEVGETSSVDNRVFFERDPMTQAITIPGSGVGSVPLPDTNPLKAQLENGMPLHLFSDRSSRLAFVIEMNQPVNPGPDNIASSRLFLQAEQTLNAGDFQTVPSSVKLVRNCTTTGATLRLVPEGVLPPNVRLRLVIAAEFEDLAGVRHLAPINNFGRIQTRELVDGMGNPVSASDEVLEEFDIGAAVPGSFEDANAAFPEPKAIWGVNGRLQPRFDFQGTGGPGGAFDLLVRASAGPLVIDTTFAIVQDANQTLSQTVINGRLDVRNLTVESGALLQFRGPNPMVINATGDVVINGEVEMNGFSAKDVAGVNTATFPEPGAAGNLGGGKGGDASIEKTSSTIRGSHGSGAFGVPNTGGRGGEAGFGKEPSVSANNSNPDFRKGGGGGGGVLGRDPDYSPFTNLPADLTGLAVLQGALGHVKATGAITGAQPQGGLPGNSPFVDATPGNDFFGVQFNSVDGTVVRGELTGLLAGAGGGGGGDSVRSAVFPHPSFTNSTDDKGGAGGGGSGGFHLRALGNVTFGPNGRLRAEGGTGARGQLIQYGSNFFEKSGAGGGGGSGGHVIIETAKSIDLGTATEVISARGGNGGAGSPGAANNNNAARGGEGGPGLVQLHAAGTITFATEMQLHVVPIPVGWEVPVTMSTPPKQLVPNFGRISKARSRWIPLGGAVGMAPDDVRFLFDGTDELGMFGASGLVLDRVDRAGNPTPDGLVDDLAEVIGPRALTTGTPGLDDDHTLRFDVTDASTMFGAGDSIYGENPILMKNFVLVLQRIGSPATFRRYNIAAATYDPASPDDLLITTASTALPFSEFIATVPGGLTSVEFRIIPRFFRVVTSGVEDSLPPSSSIKILFEGTGRAADGTPLVTDASGNPAILVPFNRVPPDMDPLTPDGHPGNIDDLWDPNAAAMLTQPIHFFRFQVEFNLDVPNTGVTATSPRPVLEFLRIPFTF
jgi:hypothetical protein